MLTTEQSKSTVPYECTIVKTSTGWIRSIAFFMLLKALALLVVIVMSLSIVQHEPTQVVTRWALVFHVDPNNYYLHRVLAWLLWIDIKQLELFVVGTGIYALLFTIEGVGLWLSKTWAEYLTIVSTASLLPVEGYELVQHINLTKCTVFLLNAAIVAYLVEDVRQRIVARQFSRYNPK